MNALSPIAAAAFAARERHDGWTPDRQRTFCEAIAEGETVAVACARASMTPSSAYALRARAAGATFALGWDAARLLGRERLGDELHTRALEGITETVTRADGSTITRHRYDNRLALVMLKRADHHAEAKAGASGQAARLVAAEFDAFLDLLQRGDGPARAGLFLGSRLGEDPGELAPVIALARADTWLRTGAGRGQEVDIADLDPARRGAWSAEQWVRAEAAGLLALAVPAPEAQAVPEAETAHTSPLSPLCPDACPETPTDAPVWWDEDDEDWRTIFAPPDGFVGNEQGDFGEEGYSRCLDDREVDQLRATLRAEYAPARVESIRARDAWLVALAADEARDLAAAAAAAGEGEGEGLACVPQAPSPRTRSGVHPSTRPTPDHESEEHAAPWTPDQVRGDDEEASSTSPAAQQ